VLSSYCRSVIGVCLFFVLVGAGPWFAHFEGLGVALALGDGGGIVEPCGGVCRGVFGV
jgi:hypothetical protein